MGRQLVSACWPPANTVTGSSHTGQAGCVGFGVDGASPLDLFSMFVGSRTWGIFHTRFSFLSFCVLFHRTQRKDRSACSCALRPGHTRARPQAASLF